MLRRLRTHGGEGPPSSYSSLTFSLDGRRVSLWSLVSMAWEGREPLRDWICLSVSLCFCAPGFCPGTVSFISGDRHSDWGESFAQIFLVKLAFMRHNKSVNRLTGGPGECQARPGGGRAPLSPGHLGHRFTLILPPENPKYSKIILHPFLSRLDSV